MWQGRGRSIGGAYGSRCFILHNGYSGNYYRTNQADQLVAVAGEQDATVFTFAQANSRICVGKKAAFYCMVPLEEKAEDRDAEAVESGEAYEDAFDFSD